MMKIVPMRFVKDIVTILAMGAVHAALLAFIVYIIIMSWS
jgi:hypothetical protein